MADNRQLTFKGTHKEIGEQVGNLYKQWGKKEIAVPPITEYYKEQLEIYTKFFPQYLEYLEGISLGLGIDKDRVLESYLTGFLPIAWKLPNNKCSAFVVKNDKEVFVGRNYDWREISEKFSRLINFEITDYSGNNFTGITDGIDLDLDGGKEFILCIDEAWNDKGLYIALNAAPGSKRQAGMSPTDLIQLVAEQTDSVDKAIELISQIPTPDSKIFTLADKAGNMAVVEKSIEKGTKVRREEKLVIATNHYNHPDLLSENIQLFKDVPFHSTFARYHYLEYNLQQMSKNLDLQKISQLMSKPPVQQNWRGKDMGDVITVWTTALNLTTQQYQVEFSPLINPEWVKTK